MSTKNIFTLMLLPTVLSLSVSAARMSFSWHEPTRKVDGSLVEDLEGYKVHCGEESGVYTVVHDVGLNNACTLEQLEDGKVYYLAVKAYMGSGVESGFSDEIVWKSPLPDVTMTLGWGTPNTNTDGTPIDDLGGYRVHYGTQSGVYTHQVDAGLSPSVGIPGLLRGHAYFFAVTAYDEAGQQSPYSEEMIWVWGDHDLDGLKDDWERAYFGSVNDPGALPQADMDGDGRNAATEFIMGSDPTAREPVFLPMVMDTQGGQPRVQFFAHAPLDAVYDGYVRYYAVERLTGSLAEGSWETLPGYERILAADQPVFCPIENADSGASSNLYRYRVWLEVH